MSGVVKGVKKVFKKVVKTAKKILPAALGIGALVFTGGAAMGVLPSWGTAITNLTQSLGGESTLTNVLAGAVTQAGYGAVLGAGTAALTGGDIGEGAGVGAAVGAVSGGVMGGMGFETDPLRDLGRPSDAPVPGVANGPPTNLLPSQAGQGVGPMGTPGVPASPAGVTTGPLMTQGAPAGEPGLLAPNGWVERNQELVGGAIKGLGSGLLAGLDDDDDSYARGYETRQAMIDRNYAGAGSGLLAEGDTSYIAAGPQRPTPLDPMQAPGFWQYDPSRGRIVYIPKTA